MAGNIAAVWAANKDARKALVQKIYHFSLTNSATMQNTLYAAFKNVPLDGGKNGPIIGEKYKALKYVLTTGKRSMIDGQQGVRLGMNGTPEHYRYYTQLEGVFEGYLSLLGEDEVSANQPQIQEMLTEIAFFVQFFESAAAAQRQRHGATAPFFTKFVWPEEMGELKEIAAGMGLALLIVAIRLWGRG